MPQWWIRVRANDNPVNPVFSGHAREKRAFGRSDGLSRSILEQICFCRGNRAFSLVEISFSFLLAVLLLHGFLNLLLLSSQRFSQQEETVVCLSEASFLHAQLRRDFESCFSQSTASQSSELEVFGNSVIFKDHTLEFDVLSGKDLKRIKYSYDPNTREIQRQFEGKITKLGQGRLASFSVESRFLLNDGMILSTSDPAFSTAKADATRYAYRQWLEVSLLMRGKATRALTVEQPYLFRVFPHLLNKQIRSIWRNG